MTILLHALSLENYRGIGPDPQYMTDFKQLNFFVGTNNSGKSIILNYISRYIAKKAPEPIERLGIDSIERFKGKNGGTPNAKIGVPHKLVSEKMIASITNWGIHGDRTRQLAIKLFDTAAVYGQIWLYYSLQNRSYVVKDFEADITNDENYNANWQNLTSAITPSLKGGLLPSRRDQAIEQLKTYAEFQAPETNIIPAKRELGPTGEAFEGLSGKGLIDQLAEIQSPDHHERDKRLTFDNINKFVSNVIGKLDAKIEVPHDRKHLIVHIDGKVLPLSSLGTGIHEVILIAAFCTLKEDQIICIEDA